MLKTVFFCEGTLHRTEPYLFGPVVRRRANRITLRLLSYDYANQCGNAMGKMLHGKRGLRLNYSYERLGSQTADLGGE